MTSLTRLRAEDSGFTLVELLIAITLLTVVGSVMVGGMVSAYGVQTYTEQRVQATTSLQRALSNAGREVRAADSRDISGAPLGSVSATALEFDTFRGTERLRFTYSVTGQVVNQRRRSWPATASPASTTPSSDSTTQLIAGVQNTAAQPIFAVRNEVGGCLTGCLMGATLRTTTLTAAELQQAATVDIRFVRVVGAGRPPIDLRTRVALRNR